MIFNIPKPFIICLILSVLLTSTTGSSLTVPETDPVEITPVEIPPEEEVDEPFFLSPTDALSEEEMAVEDNLTRMKRAADSLYPETTPYGIIDWNEDTPVNEDLYDFCKELPKGGDLHVHDELSIPIEEYIEIIEDYPGIMVDLAPGDTRGYLYISDAPATALPLQDALAFGLYTEAELRESLILSENDYPGGRWTSFNKAFNVKRNLSSDNKLAEKLYEAGFRHCCENNVDLLELRVSKNGDESALRSSYEAIRTAYYNTKADYPDFIVRIIAVIGKKESVPVEDAVRILRSAIKLSGEILDEWNPSDPKPFIIGLDLVNNEDTSKPLYEYKEFLSSPEVKNSGLKLFLHAGESLRHDNMAVRDAIELGAKRLGHAFNLYRYPYLMEECREKGIAIEVCPISNHRLGYVNDLRLHPAYTYIQNGLPVVIASDDGLFLESDPLVNDYYAAILSWDLNLMQIKELCRNNFIYSGLDDDTVNELLSKWDKKWEAFIESQQ